VAGALPQPTLPGDRVLACIERELAVGAVLWESHRQQLREPSESEWLDDLLRDKAHGSLEYVFTLLSLVLPHQPLLIAFRSLHTEDAYLRGTALEYLDGVLPPEIRQRLWPFLVRSRVRPSAIGRTEAIASLLRSSRSMTVRGAAGAGMGEVAG
jgi:hypothetical protein